MRNPAGAGLGPDPVGSHAEALGDLVGGQEPLHGLARALVHERRNVFFADGEDQEVKRQLGMKLLERGRLEAFRSLVAAEVDRLIDEFGPGGR